MEQLIGHALKYGDNINTDIISPPQYMELSIADAVKYAMSAVDPLFSSKVKAGDFFVAENNLGSGSSRETSPLTLKHLGIQAVVACSFARIFYRNCINIGLPAIECEDADKISDGDKLEIDLMNGIIHNLTTQEKYLCTKLPSHLMEIILAGGLLNLLDKQLHG